MKYNIMAIDPGTQHTGLAIGATEPGGSGTLEILAIKKIEKLKSSVWRRITGIIDEVRDLIDEYGVLELWIEMFVPYAQRRGAMHNMNLVGALLYMPVTRNLDMVAYAIQAAEWKRWVKGQVPFAETPFEAMRALCHKFSVPLSDADLAAIADPHCADALGILMFSHFGSYEREHAISNVQD